MYSHNLLLERVQRAIIDGVAVFTAALIAVWIRHGSGWVVDSTYTPWSTYLFPAVVLAVLTVFTLHLLGWYRAPHRVVPTKTLLWALGLATVIALTVGFFYREESYSRATVLIFVPLAAVMVTGMRYAYDHYVKAIRRTPAAVRRVLIVGRTRAGMKLARSLGKRPVYYELVGFVDDSSGEIGNGGQPRVLGTVAALGSIVDDLAIDEVLICLPDDPDRVMDVIGRCMRHKVAWKAMPNMFGLRLDRVAVDDFDGIPLVGPHSSHLVGFSWVLKRGFDVLVAAIALILLLPILLVVAIAIRVSSRGPVLFEQTRVGLNGEPFTMLKFRTMKTGTLAAIHADYTREWIYGRTGSTTEGDLAGSNGSDGSPPEVHKLTDDPRITKVGKLLRTASLDELPQFWNVIRGDMSVVGPRPAVPYEVERYTEWHKRRLAVPPGITGAWQVSGRNDLSFEEMVSLDVDYIEQWSINRDVKIVLRTVPAVLRFGGE